MAAKFSILCPYRRIFSSQALIVAFSLLRETFAIAIIIVAVFNALWSFAVVLTLCFQCIPVNKGWDP